MYAHLRKQRGFTLVELMIVVAIVGVLAALAIYGVQRYIANAKTAEAKNALGQISKDSKSAYAREQMDKAGVLAPTEVSNVSNRLCENGPAVPATLPAAQKVQSDPADWKDGWVCLRFSMTDPQYYQYSYETDAQPGGSAGTYFKALAVGDLDGDTVTSEFLMEGKVTSGELFVSPTINELRPEE